MNTSLDKIHKAIIERDKKDAKICAENRRNLNKVGLRLYKPKRIIKINTGKVIGVENVVNLIAKQLKENEKMISIEGTSGCGKSSTAEMLAKKINAVQISVGELIRYLTYYIESDQNAEPKTILSNLSYKIINNKACLFKRDNDLLKKIGDDLHIHNIDLLVADVARICQAEVIKFMLRETKHLAENSQYNIIIDGRAHSLDFLPSDLRVILYADAGVRAERRLKQDSA